MTLEILTNGKPTLRVEGQVDREAVLDLVAQALLGAADDSELVICVELADRELEDEEE